MSAGTFALLASAIVAAGFVQGTTGVGFALIVAPVMGLIAPQLLPASLLLLMLPLNAYFAWRERSAIDGAGATWITGGRFVGTFGGLWLLALSAAYLNAIVGAATILAAVASLAVPPFNPNRRAYAIAGIVTGVTETATGIGGPPLALVYQHRPAATLRSTIALCFLVGELMSIALLFLAGTGGASPISRRPHAGSRARRGCRAQPVHASPRRRAHASGIRPGLRGCVGSGPAAARVIEPHTLRANRARMAPLTSPAW